MTDAGTGEPTQSFDLTGNEDIPAESTPDLRVEFCDEWFTVTAPGPFLIGREGDLQIDDNPYLHRTFLQIRWKEFWWIDNVGSLLSATVSDIDGALHSWLAPGASLPLLFASTEVRFTAGPTNYCMSAHQRDPAMAVSGTVVTSRGSTTLQPVSLTDRQRCVVLALAEPSLRSNERFPSTIPSSAEAAERLGWKLTAFNRQLDTVCQKLAKVGAQGLHGGPEKLASGRRGRLVEYALAVRLVSPDDLPLLDRQQEEAH